MAKKKNRLEKLRDENRRRRMMKRAAKILLAFGVLAALLGAGAYELWQVPEVQSVVKSVVRGNRAGKVPLSPEYREVAPNQSFSFAGGGVTVDSIHTSTGIRSAFGGGAGNEPADLFRPKRDAWLLVFLTFKGSPYAETGNMNPDTVQLVDEDNNVYVNEASGSPAQDVYIESSSTAFGNLLLMQAAPQRSVLIFDIPKDARGLLLTFLREEEGEIKVLYGMKLKLKQLGGR